MDNPGTHAADPRATRGRARWLLGGIALLAPLLGGSSLLFTSQNRAEVSPDAPSRLPSSASSPSSPPSLPTEPTRLAESLAAREPARPPLGISAEEQANGYNECVLPDRGPGYLDAPKALFDAVVHFPKKGGIREDGGVDVVLHFNGSPGARKALMPVARGVALVGFEKRKATDYAGAFQNQWAFAHLLSVIEGGLQSHTKNPRAHIAHLALSCWSGGCSAVRAILQLNPPRVDAVVLLDGLHATYAGSGTTFRDISQIVIQPLVDFARQAAAGERVLYLTHSAIETPEFASTTKTTVRLLHELNLQRTPATTSADPLGLSSYLDQGNLHIRSYKGVGPFAHCDHLRFVADAVTRYLEPAWNTPSAR